MSSPRTVAVVLHAHLPYVLPPDDTEPASMAERWLYEALWGSYLPIIELLDGLARDGVRAPITLSVSPTLAAMLASALAKPRFERYLDRLFELNAHHRADLRGEELAAAVTCGDALQRARASFERIDGDVMGRLRQLHRAGHIELMTTAVSHAYLPALAPAVGAVEAQLRLGRMAFERWASPSGTWIPECGIDHHVDRALAVCGTHHALVAAHAAARPILSDAGVRYFPRHRDASLRVWARDDGYPGHESYREFHRDAGLGLKYWRIGTRERGDKQPYVEMAGAQQARAHAADYADYLGQLNDGVVAPAFDAELFGHWWYEGPLFLDALLRHLADSPAVEPATLGALTLGAATAATRAAPSPSSWGEGGYSNVWLGTRTAPLVRHVHRAFAHVANVVRAHREAHGLRGRWLDQAIRELMLLQASDWAFMIDAGRCADYGSMRFHQHRAACWRFAELAAGRAQEVRSDRLNLQRGEAGFLAPLVGSRLRGGLLGDDAAQQT